MQKVLRGRGSVGRVRELMEKLGITRPLVVGRSMVKYLPEGVAEVVYGGYHPNPDWADCEGGRALYVEKGCDGIISIGGGSAMDTAKGVKALLLAEDADKALRNEFDGEGIPHIAIPATAGTGSEATPYAVVYVNNRKISVTHTCLIPEGVVLDSALLDTLPEYHKKACALDALSQGIESYWAKTADDDSRVQAYLAIIGLLDNIRGYLAGDPNAATAMLESAYRSGKAIAVTRTTAPHAMSYMLTKTLGIAHGHACALTLPWLWEHMCNDEAVLPTMMELASCMRLGSELVGPKFLYGMLIDLGMEAPDKPSDEVFEKLVDSVNLERLGNHPVPLTREDLARIYRRAFVKPVGPARQACIDIWKYYGK